MSLLETASWSEAAAWACGIAILVLCAIALWPRKKRGLARPVYDERSSLDIFRNMMSRR